jgi:hypothetical protein
MKYLVLLLGFEKFCWAMVAAVNEGYMIADFGELFTATCRQAKT